MNKKTKLFLSVLALTLPIGLVSCGSTGAQGEQGEQGEKGKDAPHAGETHTVTFVVNGGVMPEGSEYEVSVNWGDCLVLPEPTYEGYVFLGWFTGGDSANNPERQWYNTDAIFTDITLTAHWKVAPFQITHNEVEGVSFEISNEAPDAGESVTVKVTSTNVYKTLSVSSEDVELVEAEGSTDLVKSFTFVMPEKNVALSATLEDILANINSSTPLNFSDNSEVEFTYSQDGVELESLEGIIAGSEVSLFLSNFYTKGSRDAYLYIGDEVISAETSQNKDTYRYECTFTFTMPVEDVDIIVAGGAGSTGTSGYTVELGELPAGVHVYGVLEDTTYISSTLNFVIVEDAGYVASGTYSIDGGDSSKLTIDEDDTEAHIYNLSSASKVSINITAENNGVTSISYLNNEHLTDYNGEALSLVTSGTVGKTLTISSFKVASGYYITSSNVKITTASGETVKHTLSSYSYSSSYTLTFVLPSEAVTVDFGVTENGKINVEDTSEFLDNILVSSSWISSFDGTSIASAAPSTYLYVAFKPKAGYKISKIITVDDEGNESSLNMNDFSSYVSGAYYSTFYMPSSGSVTIKFEYGEAKSLTVDNSSATGGTISTSSSTYSIGETVSVSVSLSSKLYELSSLTVVNNDTEVSEEYTVDNGKLTLHESYSGNSYSFTMPDANITISPNFIKLASTTFKVVTDENIKGISVSSNEYSVSINEYSLSEAYEKEIEGLETDSIYYATATVSNTLDKVVVMNVTYSDGTTETIKSSSLYENSYYGTIQYYFQNFTSIKLKNGDITLTQIAFSLQEKETFKGSVEVPEGSAVTYTMTVGGTTVTSLDEIKEGSILKISLNSSSFEEGYTYSFKVYNADTDAEITYSSYSGVTVNSNIKIVISRKEIAKFTIDTTLDTGYSFSNMGMYIDGTYNYYASYSSSTPTLCIGSEFKLTYVSIYASNSSSFTYTVTIVNGDETLTVEQGTFDSNNPYVFTVKGDVSISFTINA